jgi:hypothetical protein
MSANARGAMASRDFLSMKISRTNIPVYNSFIIHMTLLGSTCSTPNPKDAWASGRYRSRRSSLSTRRACTFVAGATARA